MFRIFPLVTKDTEMIKASDVAKAAVLLQRYNQAKEILQSPTGVEITVTSDSSIQQLQLKLNTVDPKYNAVLTLMKQTFITELKEELRLMGVAVGQ
jgi:hypothetical protein